MKRFFILFIIFTLTACAFPQYKTVYSEQDNGYQKTFDKDKPLKSLKAIDFISIDDNGVLTVKPKVLTEYDELEVPVVNRVAKDKKSPDPIGAILATGLTVGLNLLFATGETFKMLTGDSKNERIIDTSLDFKRARKTGVKIWNTTYTAKTGRIKIEGLIEGPLILFSSNNEYKLAQYIKVAGGNEALAPIFVTCLECSPEMPPESGGLMSTRVDIPIGDIRQKLK
ncbi:MAG: hypothetical protein WCK52_11215 [Betaproteobacteria bacterium]